MEDLRGFAPWNLPTFGFCGMRSGSYKSEVTNWEDCSFLCRNPSWADELALWKKLWAQDLPGHLDKLGSILNAWMSCHFAAQLGMMPIVRVESKGPWGKLSLSPWLINSEYSSTPFMSRAGIPTRRTWPPVGLTRRRVDLALWLAPFFSQNFFPHSWMLSNLPTSWFLGYELLLPFLPNVPRAPLVAPSIPRPSPSPAEDTKEEKTRKGAAQFILSKNVPIPPPPGPDLAH